MRAQRPGRQPTLFDGIETVEDAREAAMGFVLGLVDMGRALDPPPHLTAREAMAQFAAHCAFAAAELFGSEVWVPFVEGLRARGCTTLEMARLESEQGESLQAVLEQAWEWSRATFPTGSPRSCALHLRREVEELLADPTNPGELADCLILVSNCARHAGVDLARAAAQKLEECRGRQWGAPDADGVVEHLRAVPS